MDIYCPVCGEPWDNDELHYMDEPYQVVAKRFRTEGCEVFGSEHGNASPANALAAQAAYEVLGDDMDGASAMVEDFGFLME